MNRNILTFGKYKGKSFEWVLFNAPWYFHWMHKEKVLETAEGSNAEMRAYFNELYRRADGLVGVCAKCKQRQFTRFDISDLVGSCSNGLVGLYCDGCFRPGTGLQFNVRPSFFSVARKVPRSGQKTITRAIKDHYLGGYSNLTQAKMEEFFQTDEFFSKGAPGFFAKLGKDVLQ